AVGDVHVPQALSEQREDLELTIGESLWIRACSRARSTREAARAALREALERDKRLHGGGRPDDLRGLPHAFMGEAARLRAGTAHPDVAARSRESPHQLT